MRIYDYNLSWWYKNQVLGSNLQGSANITAVIEYNRNFYNVSGFLPSILNKKDQLSRLVDDYTNNSYGDCSDELENNLDLII